MSGSQTPGSQNNGKIISESDPVSGETVTYTYDSLNRLASATSSDNPGWGQSFGYDGFGNLTTSTDIVSGATYNPMGELLTMTGVNGAPSETRSYNSIGQMTALTSGSLQRTYAFSSSSNNSKITAESDPVSGGTVTYTSLNRLLTAQTDYLPVSRLTADH